MTETTDSPGAPPEALTEKPTPPPAKAPAKKKAAAPTAARSPRAAADPEADEFGWYRVTDKDTGHKLSVRGTAVLHGNYTILKQPASDANGEPLPPEFNTTGQSATTSKESTHG